MWITAIALARQNMLLNLDMMSVETDKPETVDANGCGGIGRLSPDVISFVEDDALKYMKRQLVANKALNQPVLYDIVVCDPPKLATSVKGLHKAINKYVEINALAMQLVVDGGLLCTFSCSGVIAQQGKMTKILQLAAKKAGKRVTVLKQLAPGNDHPISLTYLEGVYLSGYLVRVCNDSPKKR